MKVIELLSKIVLKVYGKGNLANYNNLIFFTLPIKCYIYFFMFRKFCVNICLLIICQHFICLLCHIIIHLFCVMNSPLQFKNMLYASLIFLLINRNHHLHHLYKLKYLENLIYDSRKLES